MNDVLQPEVPAVTAESPANHEACISVCAQTVANHVCEYTVHAGLNMAKITGCRNGVVTRMKLITLSTIGVHHAVYRLNLASSQAANAVPYVSFSSFVTSRFICTMILLRDALPHVTHFFQMFSDRRR